MSTDDTKGSRRKNGRNRARRRKELDEDEEIDLQGIRGTWKRGGKQVTQSVLFGIAIVFICFVGQDPPGLRSLGEFAPENIYSDRSFKFLSEIRRKEAEEWIRSSTPREFASNMVGEVRFQNALTFLKEGLLTIDSLDQGAAEVARVSFLQDLEANFQLSLTMEELLSLSHWRHFPDEVDFFQTVTNQLKQMHFVGVVKFPSLDQKFISEANASARIDASMLEISNRLVVVNSIKDGFKMNLKTEELELDYPEFLRYLIHIREHLENDGPFPERGLSLAEVIERSDENASLSAQRYRNEIASNFSKFVRRGLFLKTIDREATTAAQNHAIASMEPPIVSIEEGDLILKKGLKVTEEDFEKYSTYLNLTTEDRNLLPRRIFVTIGTFLFALVYVSLVLPTFWRDSARTAIVALVILINLGISRFVLELGGTDLFGENNFLVSLLPYFMPVAFASMVVMITVGPRMATLTGLMTSIFHATMQNSGIDSLCISLSTSLVGAYFCRDVRLRGSVLKAGAMAGLVGAFLALGIGFASQSGGVASANHALASLVVGFLTGGLVLAALPAVENGFKVATDATLFELTDFNHPLLRRMQVEAPGTYHHSLMVANLAENAALVVGANPTMCRACSLFHDIGKMAQPNYFNENQGEFGNPHNRQNPAMSALIIKSHVKEGVEMARENRLPQVLRHVIRQHHGTTLVKYFYHQAKKRLQQETMNYGESDPDEPDESTYRYDGPKPRFKESAIIFFADSVEAATRSLQKVTHHSVEELLESIFQDRLEDGQLDECPLTLEEIAKIKESFTKTTLNMLHSRIEYPDDEPNGNEKNSNPVELSSSAKKKNS